MAIVAAILSGCGGGSVPLTKVADAPAPGPVEAPAPITYVVENLGVNPNVGLAAFDLGQTFEVPTTAQLKRLELHLRGYDLDVTVALFATAAGMPTGPALATSGPKRLNLMDADYAFDFPSAPTLTGGTTYAFMASAPAGVQAPVDTTAGYAKGTVVVTSPLPAYDLRFRVHFSY